MTAIEIACRFCAAQPYELCVQSNGKNSPFTHAERIEDAAGMEDGPPADPQLVDEAIERVVDESL